jgi:hypothetical protein
MNSPEHLPIDLARLREQHEAARLKLEIRQLHEAAGVPLYEEWGDPVDRREALFDRPAHREDCFAAPAAFSDRSDGRFLPVYEVEQDLAQIRGAARRISAATSVAIGALDALANYVLAGGFTFTAHSEFDQPRLVTAAQRVIDEFLDANDFSGGLDRELHFRSRQDGEAFLALLPRSDGTVSARVLEPEQIVQPANPGPLEEWLGIAERFESSWSFGVHTPREAAEKPLGYHVIFDAEGRDWEYFPAGSIEHIKRNVPRSAKRGVSDLYSIEGDLEREAKLRRNTAEGAALQAAVAWILQAPAGTTRGQMQSVGLGEIPAGFDRPARSGPRSHSIAHYPAGTVLKPSAGLEYKPGPMGSERNPNFVLVAQYVLRSIGIRWNMPEYLISGDASNANYASSLVAESPFVKAREADQQFYRRHWLALIWKVLRLAWAAGRFSRLGISWESFVRLIDVKIDAPAVSTRDPQILARTQETQIRLGLLSRRTACAQAGLDYDAELRQGAAPEPGGFPRDANPEPPARPLP